MYTEKMKQGTYALFPFLGITKSIFSITLYNRNLLFRMNLTKSTFNQVNFVLNLSKQGLNISAI